MYSCMEQSRGGSGRTYLGEQRHQSGAFPAPWQWKHHESHPGMVEREGPQRIGLQHQRGVCCLSARPSDGASQEPPSTWGRGGGGFGRGLGAAKGWRDLGIKGFGLWSWRSGDRETPVFQPGPWHPLQQGKGCWGDVRTRAGGEDRPPYCHSKGDSAYDVPQLPVYEDKSKKTPFVCWFTTTPQYGFSRCLAGEGPRPIIISGHWCNSNNIECSLYGNSLGAFIFSPGNLLMTALVANRFVRNDFKRFPWGVTIFLPAKCLPTLVANAMQRWRGIFPFLIVSLLYAFW